MSDTFYQNQWDKHLDTSFDSALKPFLSKGMSWLPWIGREFSKSAGRILIVGESHYTNEQDTGKVVDKKAACHCNELLTREVMAEYPLEGRNAGWLNNGGRRNNPTFDNLHRALLKTDLLRPADMDKRGRLWDQIAFYNFVQNVMDYGKDRPKERPSDGDFYNAWSLFIHVVGVLHPKTCVFVGVRASNTFNNAMRDLGIQFTLVQREKRLNGVYERSRGSVTIEGETMKLVFIKHTSKFFSWRLWNNYLETIMPDNMVSLRNSVLNGDLPE